MPFRHLTHGIVLCHAVLIKRVSHQRILHFKWYQILTAIDLVYIAGCPAWCRWWDLNPHDIATNGFWVRHVCQFHHIGIWLWWLDSNQRNAGVKVLCLTTWLHHNILLSFQLSYSLLPVSQQICQGGVKLVEQVKGIEPSSSDWKSDILAFVLHLHKIKRSFRLSTWLLVRCLSVPTTELFYVHILIGFTIHAVYNLTEFVSTDYWIVIIPMRES